MGETVYEMRIPSRGYGFVLDPPLPVNVLEGEIKGEQKKPILAAFLDELQNAHRAIAPQEQAKKSRKAAE